MPSAFSECVGREEKFRKMVNVALRLEHSGADGVAGLKVVSRRAGRPDVAP